MNASFDVKLRGRTVEVSGEITPREPDVGIMSEGIEQYTLRDADTGEVLDWELTDDEELVIQTAACSWAADDEEPYRD